MSLETLSTQAADELRIDDELHIETQTDTISLNNTRISFSPASNDYIGSINNPDIYDVRNAFLDFTNTHRQHLQTLKDHYKQQLAPGALNTLRKIGHQAATALIGTPGKQYELSYINSAHAAGDYLATTAPQHKHALTPLQNGLAITLAHCGDELVSAAEQAQQPLQQLLAEYHAR